MDFVEIDIPCSEDLKDILTAELSELGYDSFLDTSDGIKAYQPMVNHNPDFVGKLLQRYTLDRNFKSRKLSERNWNEIWEKSFEPIEIDNECRIRASFHQPDPSYAYELVIDPKMSFGTGHHETTRQVIRFQLGMDLMGKSVLDVGCGTGILSILAEKLGAEMTIGIDNDPNSIDNAIQNSLLNGCNRITLEEGTVDGLHDANLYDIIIANINKNVLLQEIKLYRQHLNKSGYLILSGFYTFDSPDVVKECEDHALELKSRTEENQWACLLLENKIKQ